MTFTKYQFAAAAWIAFFVGVGAAIMSIWQHSPEWAYTAGVVGFVAMVFGFASSEQH